MGSEWQECIIQDISDVKSGKRLPKGKKLVNNPTDHPYIRLVDIDNGRVRKTGLKYLDNSVQRKISKYIVQQNDVCLAIVGHTIGMVFWVDAVFDGANLTENAVRLTNFQGVESRYLFYWLNSPAGQYEIESRIVGSAQGKLPLYNIKSLPVSVPPRPEQKAIAHVLGSLDDRIELNRQMNETLEAMAQALFKSWFVDFDPVIDNALASGKEIPAELSKKAQARAALGDKRRHLPEEIRALFPDEFTHSDELGWIPKGWEVAPFGSITTELRRGISPKYIEEGGVRVVNQRCIRNHEVDYSLARRNDEKQRKVEGRFLEEGDLLINSTGVGTLGRMAQAHVLDEPTVVDSHVTIARADRSKYKPYTFARMMLSFEPYIEAMGEGSTGQTELSRKNLAQVQAIVPSHEIQRVAEEYFKDFFEKATFNLRNADALRLTRDTLLPKLLSGELRISDAKKMVEDLAL